MSTTTTATNSSTAPKTPYEEYFARRKEWLNRPENKAIIASTLIQGIDRNDDSDDDNEEGCDKSKYTTEQMNSLRFLMLTKEREAQLESMERLILQDQYDSPYMMFGTSFSYHVLDSWIRIKSRLSRMSPDKKFDALLAFTSAIHDHDVWVHDNEGDMGELVKGLATVWRNLLKKSDAEIGWDVEYTKPAVYALLKQFKDKVEGMEEYYNLGKFKYE
jgi:hypothetical protein